MPRKFIAYLAISADGFIARKDGSVDWLDRPHPKGDYGMPAFLKSIDTILWGRKTYEWVQPHGGPASVSTTAKHYVFSTTPQTAEGVTFVNTPIPQFAKNLRRRAGSNVWLMGGAGLFGSFLDARQIDEIILHIIPTAIGEGIPLFAPAKRNVEMTLLSSRRFADSVVRLHYAIPARR
jgi:dihydrofolate reductase